MPSPTSTERGLPCPSVRRHLSPFQSFVSPNCCGLPGRRRDELKRCLTSGVLLFAKFLAIRQRRIIDNGTGLSGCAPNAVHPTTRMHHATKSLTSPPAKISTVMSLSISFCTYVPLHSSRCAASPSASQHSDYRSRHRFFCSNLAQSNATAHRERLIAYPDICADYTCGAYCHRRLLYDCMNAFAHMYHGDLGVIIASNLGGASVVVTHLRCLFGFPGRGSLWDRANSGFAITIRLTP